MRLRDVVSAAEDFSARRLRKHQERDVDDHSPTQSVDRIVGMRLRQFQQATRLPVVFGGATAAHRLGRKLRIGHVRGTIGHGLVDLSVGAGRGLGGSAIVSASLRMVQDYASTRSITHDFDGIVVHQEQISSIFAMPVVVGGSVEAIIYGAVRGPHPIGDVILERATTFGASLEEELAGILTAPASNSAKTASLWHTQAAIAELADLAKSTSDKARRSSIDRLIGELQAIVGDDLAPVAMGGSRPLAPREIDVLRLVAVGMANAEVAASLGLTRETVRAYLRNAMRKLNVGNRTAAVHVASQLGML
jgi:DNA-binding CsgD family transcriptional regulator